MVIDYSFNILEAILMAKEYKSRDEVISTARLIADVAGSLEKMEPDWREGFTEALSKLKTLNFSEMNEIISILKSYEENDEEDKEAAKTNQKEDNSRTDYSKPEKEEMDISGDMAYQKGMEFYAQEEFEHAAMCFRSAAYKGHVKAEFNYALCLYHGTGLPMNRVEAIKRFVFTSMNGVVQADQVLHYIAYGN